MNEPLQYVVYKKVSFSNPFLHSSWENIIEGIFPTEYNPDMSFETKREMHTQLIYTLMKDTRGWLEQVRIKDLRDPERRDGRGVTQKRFLITLVSLPSYYNEWIYESKEENN